MRGYALAMLALMATLAPISSAPAQLASGYSGQSGEPTQGVPDDYWYLLRQIGPCVAQGKSRDAGSFLATEPGSPDETRVFKKLFGTNSNVCMQNFVSAVFLRSHLRGAVAEGMYKRQIASGVEIPAPIASVGDQPDIQNLHDFARCYVIAHPNEAHSLVTDTTLSSDREAAAIRVMAGNFASCLPANRQVKLTPVEVRMSIAEALYRRVLPVSTSGAPR